MDLATCVFQNETCSYVTPSGRESHFLAYLMLSVITFDFPGNFLLS